jgi:putative tryptophan/tyrosine transport system substrate-binding protein
MLGRRNLLLAPGLTALGLTARAISAGAAPPPGKVLRLGILDALAQRFDPESNAVHRALMDGLRAHGYAVGRNLVLEYRSAGDDPGRLARLADELVQAKVDILIPIGSNPALAVMQATKTVPIVMTGLADPVGSGVIASLARPGGNITGIAFNAAEITAKRVQLLKEVVPNLSRVGVLWNSSLKTMALQFQQVEMAAPILGVTVLSVRVSGSAELDRAFAALEQNRPDGLVVLFGPMRGNDLPRIVDFVNRNKLPSIFEIDRGVEAGGLMEFGSNRAEQARDTVPYIDKIANGAKPADLPVEEPTKLKLIINTKTAKALGLAIPPAILARADEVIE